MTTVMVEHYSLNNKLVFKCILTTVTVLDPYYFTHSNEFRGIRMPCLPAVEVYPISNFESGPPVTFTSLSSGMGNSLRYDTSIYSMNPSYELYNNNHSIEVMYIEFGSDIGLYYDLAELNLSNTIIGFQIRTMYSNITIQFTDKEKPGEPTILNGLFSSNPVSPSTLYPISGITNAGINQVVTPYMTNCFNKGTKLHGPDGLVTVEDLKEGDLVSTYLHGHRKITRILRGVAFNKDSAKTHNTMCVMKKMGDMTDDLYITGGHSLMIDEMGNEEYEKQEEMGFSHKIDGKALVLAMVSSLFEAAPLGTYQHYHFVLENDGDRTARYGVWANGVLCETPSQEYIEKSLCQ